SRTGFGGGLGIGRQRRNLRPLDADAHVGRDLQNDHFIAQFYDPAQQSAGGDDLVVALERGQHLLQVGGLLGLRPNQEEVEDPEQEDQRYDGGEDHLL